MSNSSYANRLVGHRGQMNTHPENTLVGYRAAIAGGAKIVECDVQLTKDKVPVVLHDHGLSRTAGPGINGTIFDFDFNETKEISVHEPAKFGEQYHPEPIAGLAQFVELIAQSPDVLAMVELKQESIDQFDLQSFVDVVFPICWQHKTQIIIISFNADVVSAAKAAGFMSGWVIDNMDEANRETAMALLPPYLITDVLEVDVENPQLWSAPEGHQWQWMLYDVVDPDTVKSLMDKGVDLVETADIVALNAHFNQ